MCVADEKDLVALLLVGEYISDQQAGRLHMGVRHHVDSLRTISTIAERSVGAQSGCCTLYMASDIPASFENNGKRRSGLLSVCDVGDCK